MLSLLETLVTFFAIFAISRSWLRLKKGNESVLEFIFWSFVWMGVVFIMFFRDLVDIIALKYFDVGRGIDLIVYVSIVVLFYLVFRVYSKAEILEQDITKLTRTIAIEESKKKKSRK